MRVVSRAVRFRATCRLTNSATRLSTYRFSGRASTLLFGLRITARGALGKDTLSFNPSLVRRHRPVVTYEEDCVELCAIVGGPSTGGGAFRGPCPAGTLRPWPSDRGLLT